MRGNIHYIDEHRLIYVAGHYIILYNTEDKTQTYFNFIGDPIFTGISRIAMSPQRR
jgi:hypothetical protein